jgi:hypothetical protein
MKNNNLLDLEYKLLMNNTIHYRDEYEILRDMVSNIEIIFNDNINEYLNRNETLKEQWEYFNKQKDNSIEEYLNIENVKVLVEENIINHIQENVLPNKEIKKIYRDIVKNTHPDKINIHYSKKEKDNLVNIYREATNSYDNNDINSLILYAYQLSLKIDNSLIDKEKMKKDIDTFKKKIMMLENSIFWKWYNSDEIKKETILNDFLLKQMF